MNRQKRRTQMAENWIAYSRTMVESPALRVLSLPAIRVMHRIESEHMHNGGAENGRLLVTFDQFEEWGVGRKAIAPAIRELVSLGFVEIMEKGCAGPAGFGRAHRFRLTYVNMKSREQPTNEWSRVAAVEAAKALVEAAKQSASPTARALGKRNWIRRMKNKIPVPKTELNSVPSTELNGEKFGSKSGTTRLSSQKGTTIYSLGGDGPRPRSGRGA
jgi:hypothetical protein